MSKNYIGAKRKRTNTPAAARKRAVEYRHRPYIVKKAAVKAAEEVTELKDLILAEEAEPEIPVTVEEAAEEPAAEKQADTTVPSDSGAAAGGFFARAMKSIKGLFSRKEAAKEDTSLVSDVKTWLNSPIDPDAEEESTEAAEAAERRSQVGPGDRSEKIKTYNFPENRVTDHRIKFTSYRLGNILDGDLNELIDNCIAADQAAKLSAQS
ncbi:MAG: hypothetical protein Q4D59_02615 [Erysipelotrichaceae bacterium]|nr:hypothetical protein [Erysipelotrichaceae bacterium]